MLNPTKPPYTFRLIREWAQHRALNQSLQGNIAEIGCNRGATTVLFAKNFPDKKVYAMDWITNNPTMVKEQVKEIPKIIAERALDCGNVTRIDANSREYDFNLFENVTYFFIDGDHSYEGVKSDTFKAINYLKNRNGGVITLHDYRRDNKYPWIGVKDFVDKELKGYNISFPFRTQIAVIKI